MFLQTALHMIYPSHCVLCDEILEANHALCAACWRDTPFISGLACDTCGQGLHGESKTIEQCDDCQSIARPWDKGRAAFEYSENGRRLVLSLKHGDRQDLVLPAAKWMCRSGADILQSADVLVPVPLHWSRLVMRRFNQAAILAQRIGHQTGIKTVPDGLVREKRTGDQNGKSVEERFKNLKGVISPNPKRIDQIAGKRVVLIDDVMTSGATLAASTEACFAAKAAAVSVLVLARVTKDDWT